MAIVGHVDGAEMVLAEVLDLYNSVGWSAYTDQPELLMHALAGSSTVVVARDGGTLVGLARVISDGASICYVQDILVRPDHQHTGIGRELVSEVLAPYEHVRQKVLLTDDEPRQKAFHESLGFQQTTDFRGGTLRAFVRFDQGPAATD